jgi:N-formylglutamate deformylase
MQVFEYTEGSGPLLLSIPHCGTALPDDIAARMTPAGLQLADTDWHVDTLYEFAAALGAGVIRSRYSRYVVDLNRPPDDSNLYPGANSTGLCPTSSFAEQPMYREGCEPDEKEIAGRLDRYWRPYHEKLQSELAGLRERHGAALLFEAHSIRSRVPRLFEGRLPDLNIGTAAGTSCAAGLLAEVKAVLSGQTRYSHIVDGRFKGGYITSAYGRPRDGVHALQLELTQCNYMAEEPPFGYLPERAGELQPLLRQLLGRIIAWGEAQAD